MENSQFSSLIYRIIGKPERWHDDYIDVMHQILDETESFDDPENFSELAVGDQILSRLKFTNEALVAFSTLLDRSRFKMIILDEHLKPLYHNRNAQSLHQEILALDGSKALKPGLLEQINRCVKEHSENPNGPVRNDLMALDYSDQNGDQLYLRPIQNSAAEGARISNFYLLLVLDQERQNHSLNADLVTTYHLTDKEQMVLLHLIHGNSIKEIAEAAFVSENTVKTHLKSLFRKTDTKSQTEVIRLILTHESQILDSYFTAGTGASAAGAFYEQDRYLKLRDGLEIAYREYGPKTGHPVIVFHNGYGCRVTIPHNYQQICRRGNFRVIIPDRPGFGQTPFSLSASENWDSHLLEFIDHLDLKKYDIIGTVLGCPIALRHATKADKRLQRVVLASPVMVNHRRDTKHMAGILAPTARLVRASKKFAREIYELWLKSITLNLGAHYRSMLESSFGDAEKELFGAQNTIELMVEGFREGSSKSLDGISHEMVFCLTPQKLDLKNIKVPVELWWGTQDNRITRAGVENLANSIPNSTLRICDGYSEHLYYAKFEDLLNGPAPKP